MLACKSSLAIRISLLPFSIVELKVSESKLIVELLPFNCPLNNLAVPAKLSMLFP